MSWIKIAFNLLTLKLSNTTSLNQNNIYSLFENSIITSPILDLLPLIN